MGRLTTHVLDLVRGVPAAGLVVELWHDGLPPVLIGRSGTNADGRLDAPLLEGAAFQCGVYELRFHVGAYLRAAGLVAIEPPFLDIVPVRFGVADQAAHLHVPLLLSPHGYSTYRGS